MEARQIFWRHFHLHPLLVEQDFIGKLRVGFLLACFFVNLGEHFAGGLLGGFFRGDANGAARLQIHKRSGDFAPVAEFQRALAQPTMGHNRHGIGDAAVDLNVGDQPLAFGDGIVDSEFPQAEHRQAHAENLPGAGVAMRLCGKFEILGKTFHGELASPGAS